MSCASLVERRHVETNAAGYLNTYRLDPGQRSAGPYRTEPLCKPERTVKSVKTVIVDSHCRHRHSSLRPVRYLLSGVAMLGWYGRVVLTPLS